jgi:putative ABC transport system permease protein
MLLMGVFASVALVLTGIGIYGVISYSVAQRIREISVRIALGARPRDINRLVVGQGLRLAVIGVAIGAVGAAFLTKVVSNLLSGVSKVDLWTFVIAAVTLVALTILGTYIPARRARRVNPIIALKAE